MSNRSYNQYWGLAYALDIVGERWTLLIIRELTAGLRRFKDLMAGQHQFALRASQKPEQLGQALETTLLELGKWGSQFVPPSAEGATLLNVGSYALTLKTHLYQRDACS